MLVFSISSRRAVKFFWWVGCWAVFACLGKADTPAAPIGPLQQQLREFNNLGSVLHIGAHPDDENTQLITYLARGRGYRTAYLSLTRGDGGQNELGPEFGEKLGVARTQELLAARRLDGGQQFFTRAIDFGFSKNPEETLRIWNRNEILADVVRVIRRFRPDVIITRFPVPPGSGGHGHHTASAILALEAFKLAGDPHAFPEQIKEGLQPWQPKRIVWNAGGPGRAAPSAASIKVDISGFDPVTAESFASIAARSRAMHRTQGFGNFANRTAPAGPHEETFILLGGEPAEHDFMDGVDVTWNRFPNGAEIAHLVDGVLAQFKNDDPAACVPSLLVIRSKLKALVAPYIKHDIALGPPPPDQAMLRDKVALLDSIIQACLGLQVQTTVANAQVVPGEQMHLHFTANIHSPWTVRWTGVETKSGWLKPGGTPLLINLMASAEFKPGDLRDRLPVNTDITQPYWLRQEGEPGTFHVDDQTLIGSPENPPVWPVRYHFTLPDGGDLAVDDQPVQILSGVPAAQSRRLIAAIPPVSLRFVSKVSIFTPGSSRPVEVEVSAARAEISGELNIKLPAGWKSSPAAQNFQFRREGEKARFTFTVTSSAERSVGHITATADIGQKQFSSQRVEINYQHLPLLLLQPPAHATVANFEFAIRGQRVGYVPGAGDDTAEALEQLGYHVDILSGADLAQSKLAGFDAIVLGVRAFNVRSDLTAGLPSLYAYVEAGGTVVAQYNRPNGLKTEQLGPYPLSLAGDAPRLRITDEDAPVTFLDPENRALLRPNRITADDFKNWTQERGAYFPSSWDHDHYTTLLAMNDPGEPALNSSVLIAHHGKGYFVYTSLSFFRQLPAGNPGAYRLFANLVSLGKE